MTGKSFLSSLPSRIHLLYSAGLFFNHFAFGISSTVTWPALVDLAVIYSVTEETMSQLATFSSLGYLLGSLSGPLFYSRYCNRQLVISLLVVAIAVTLGLLPHYGGHLWLLFAAFTVNGFGGGSWDSSCSVWIVEKQMWSGENGRSASAISALHTTYGVGSILGPLFVARYVFGKEAGADEQTRRRSLTVPFAASAAILCIVPVLFTLLYFIRPYKKDEGEKNVEPESREQPTAEPATVQIEEHIRLRPLKLGLTALCLAFYASTELAYINFSSTVLQMLEMETEADKISAEEAAILQSVLAAAYALGRFSTSFIAVKVRPEGIMSYHYLTVLCGLLAVFFGRNYRVLVYGGTAVLGAGFSAMWPAILAFTERYMRLTHCAGTVLYFANGLLSLFSPLIVGRFLVDRPEIFFLFEGVYLLVSFLLFAVIRLGLIRKRLRFFN